MLRPRRCPALFALVIACGPATPEAGSTTTDEARTTGAAPASTSSGSSAAGTTRDDATSAPTSSAATTDGGTSSTGVVTDTGASTDTSTGTDASTGTDTGASTGPDVCDDAPLPDMVQHACDELTTLATCARGGCVWVEGRRFTAQDCACVDHGASGFCVFTPDQSWGGSSSPSAMFRVVDGAVEVRGLGLIPFAVPPGWAACPEQGSPALCDCACPDAIHCG